MAEYIGNLLPNGTGLDAGYTKKAIFLYTNIDEAI
jgi:hypothetical protein